MNRIENQATGIPYGSHPTSLFVHGDTSSRDWRTNLFVELNPIDVLILDPWKTSWPSYVNALSNEIESLEEFSSEIVTSDPGPSYTPPTAPDIDNLPFFWEMRESKNCEWKYFNFSNNVEIASHIVLLLAENIKEDPEKVIVRIPKTDWRMSISVFLKDLPRENYFQNEQNAIEKLKSVLV